MHRRNSLTLIFGALLMLTVGQLLGGVLGNTRETAPAVEQQEPEIYTGNVAVEWVSVMAPEPGIWTRTATEGRVARGETLFTGPVASEAAENRLRLLTGAVGAGELAVPQRRQQLHTALGALHQGQGDVVDVMALVLEEVQEEDLLQAQSRWTGLSAQSGRVTAPCGGIFLPGGTYPELGRIVTSEVWQLTLELPYALEVGDQIPLRLLSGIFETVSCRVEEVQWMEESCHVVLSSGQMLSQIAKIQNLTVKILPDSQIRGGNFVENKVYYSMCNFLWKEPCLCIPLRTMLPEFGTKWLKQPSGPDGIPVR